MTETPYADQNTAQQNAADASTSAKNLWQTALTEIKSTLDIFKTDDYYFYYEGLNRLNDQLTDFAKETEETIYLIESHYKPDEGDITDLNKAYDSISKFRADSNTITDSDYVQELTINLSSLISKISQNNHSTHQNILSIDEYFSLHNQTLPSLSSINQQIDSTSISVSNAIATTKTSITDIDQAEELIIKIRKYSEQQATDAATRIADFNETLSLHLENHEEKNKDLINDNTGIGKKSSINIAKTLLRDNTEAADNKARELFWGLSFSDDFLMMPDLTQESLRRFEQHLEDLKNPLAEYNYNLAELFEPDEIIENGQITDAGIEAEEQAKSESGSTAGQTVEHPEITIEQRHTDVSGGDFLKLGYALKGNDNTGNPGGDANDLGVSSSGLTNVAVLGPNTSGNNTYTLEISAESLKADWDLESADIVLKYDTQLFEKIDASHITLGDHLTLEKGIVVDDDNGLIRIAAASLSNTAFNKGDSIDSQAIFASINVDFDETYFEHSDRTPDANGKFTFQGNPLGFELSANSDETVFSRTFSSDADGLEVAGGAYTNREIQSLGDLKGNTSFDEGDINLYQAEIKFEEQVSGLTFGTHRVIGANQGFTNLIRRGDTVTAETTIENIGNSLAKDILIEDAGLVEHASFVGSRFLEKISGGTELAIADGEKVNLSGGVFRDDFSYNADGQESLNIEVDMAVTGQAGSVIDVTKGLFRVSAEGMTQNPETKATPDFFVSSAGSKNLITFKGDLNYDGRVSMKDLAYLNAGAARQQLVDSTDENGDLIQIASEESYARDVDADFNGKIDLADLRVLDDDWGKSLHDHVGTSGGFTGSSETFSMEQLDAQGTETWDNTSFKNQNAIEAESDYVGSLEAPGTSGVIGSDGNQDGNNSLEGDNFQDPLAA